LVSRYLSIPLETSRMSTIECCVCFEELPENSDLTDCDHAVCHDCLSQLRKPTCPMCRSPIELAGEAAHRQQLKEFRKKQYQNDIKLYFRIHLRRQGYRVIRI
jgi:hypothetical protein